jgi:hypothetical protein
VRKLPAITIAGTALVALGGTALAASRNNHVMSVALPDGSTARIQYVGDVAPKVVIEPSRSLASDVVLPSFAGFDRMIDEMNRQAQAMMRTVQQASVAAGPPGAPAPFVASFGTAPQGVSSTTIVSYSNGNSTCTRTTQTISQGPGKPPKVSSSVSGNCSSNSAPEPVPAPGSARLDHT